MVPEKYTFIRIHGIFKGFPTSNAPVFDGAFDPVSAFFRLPGLAADEGFICLDDCQPAVRSAGSGIHGAE